MTGLVMKYFVLKPGGTSKYAQASRRALHSFASFIRTENPLLAEELLEWAKLESDRAFIEEDRARK